VITDLRRLYYFLDISFQRNSIGLFFSQQKFASDGLHRAHMNFCNPSTFLVDSKAKLSASTGYPVPDPSFCWSLAGTIQHLTFTHPDISYVVQ
jgi:hypothetical protein